MIFTTLGLRGIDRTVTRPLARQITNDVIYNLGLPTDTGIGIGDEPDPADYTNTAGNSVDITYQDEVIDDLVMTTMTHARGVKPVIQDKAAGLSFRTIYTHNKLTINMSIFNKSKSILNKVRNDLKIMDATNNPYYSHNLEYAYYPSKLCGDLIVDVYNLKATHNPSIESINDYVKGIGDSSLNFTHTQDGDVTKTSLIFKDKQYGALGYFMGDLSNITIEEDKDFNGYRLDVIYVVKYDKPTSMHVTYPYVVCNQVMPDRYFEFIKTPEAPVKHRKYIFDDLTDSLNDILMGSTLNSNYLTIPDEDMYKLPDPIGNARLLSILATIEPDDKRTLFNLQELGTIAFKQTAIDYMKSCHDTINTPGENLMSIQIFGNDIKLPNDTLIVDADLNISAREDLNLQVTYRVTVDILTDMSNFSREKAKELEETFPEIDELWYNALANTIDGKKTLLPPLGYLRTPMTVNFSSMIYNEETNKILYVR